MGNTSYTNSGMKFTLHRCKNPFFRSNLVFLKQFFYLRTGREIEGIIGSSIRLDVSSLSSSRCFAECVEPTAHSSAKHSFGRFFVGVGKTIHTNSGMKNSLHRCENPIFMSHLFLRHQHFSLRTDRKIEDIIGSSIRLDVSYLSS